MRTARQEGAFMLTAGGVWEKEGKKKKKEQVSLLRQVLCVIPFGCSRPDKKQKTSPERNNCCPFCYPISWFRLSKRVAKHQNLMFHYSMSQGGNKGLAEETKQYQNISNFLASILNIVLLQWLKGEGLKIIQYLIREFTSSHEECKKQDFPQSFKILFHLLTDHLGQVAEPQLAPKLTPHWSHLLLEIMVGQVTSK